MMGDKEVDVSTYRSFLYGEIDWDENLDAIQYDDVTINLNAY